MIKNINCPNIRDVIRNNFLDMGDENKDDGLVDKEEEMPKDDDVSEEGEEEEEVM